MSATESGGVCGAVVVQDLHQLGVDALTNCLLPAGHDGPHRDRNNETRQPDAWENHRPCVEVGGGPDPLQPSAMVLRRLADLCVGFGLLLQDMRPTDARFARVAYESPEVQGWLADLDNRGLLPKLPQKGG